MRAPVEEAIPTTALEVVNAWELVARQVEDTVDAAIGRLKLLEVGLRAVSDRGDFDKGLGLTETAALSEVLGDTAEQLVTKACEVLHEEVMRYRLFQLKQMGCAR